MLGMQLTAGFHQVQIMDLTPLFGGISRSCLVDSELFLEESSDHANALRHIARRKNMDRYKSVIDFCVGELFSSWRPHIFRYYGGCGFTMIEQTTEQERRQIDKKLLKLLKTSYLWFCEGRKVHWKLLAEEAGRTNDV